MHGQQNIKILITNPLSYVGRMIRNRTFALLHLHGTKNKDIFFKDKEF